MRRRGNVMILVLILTAVLLSALFSLGFMTRTDASASVRLQREIRATMLAESVAAQVEAQVNGRPWRKRFWMLEAQATGNVTGPAALTLSRTSRYLDLSRDATPPADYDLVAIVKDVDDARHEYRVYVEVTLKGEPYAYSFDKRWGQALLSGMNRDATQVDKPLELDERGSTAPDSLIESIRTRADAAPPPEGAPPGQKERLDGLRKDEGSFAGSTELGPIPPPAVPQKLPEGI